MPLRRSGSIATRVAPAVLMVSGVGVTGAAAAVPPFANIPNVTIVAYPVAERDAATVRTAIDRPRPIVPHDGIRVAGHSHYDFHWQLRNDGRGNCTAAPDDIAFRATVTVPRLSGGDPQLQARFARHLDALLVHEDGHVRYAWDHRADIAAAISAATCATANAAALNAIRTISAHERAYDMATRHGMARSPLE